MMALPPPRRLVVLAQGGRHRDDALALLEQVGMQSQADRPQRAGLWRREAVDAMAMANSPVAADARTYRRYGTV
jgi:hypothetical protein